MPLSLVTNIGRRYSVLREYSLGNRIWVVDVSFGGMITWEAINSPLC